MRCERGQLSLVSLEQRGLDLRLTMRSPDDRQAVEADSPFGAFGPEALFFLAEETGDCPVEVRAREGAAPASYQILLAQRPGAPADDLRLVAQAALAEGRALRSEATPGGQEAAAGSFEAALELWHEAGEPRLELTSAYERGLLASESGQYTEAAAFLGRALPLARAGEDRRLEALVLKSLGEASAREGNAREGLELMGKAAGLFRAAGDERAEAEIGISIGWAHEFLGDKQRALDYYRRALPPLRAAGDRINEATALNNLGAAYDTLGEKQQALEALGQALALRRSIGDKPPVVETLNNIAVVHATAGEIAPALERFEEALRLVRELGRRRNEGVFLNNIAYCHAQLKHPEQALAYYGEALAFYRSAGDRGGEGNSLDQLGNLYHARGDHARALEHFQAALAIRRSQENRGNVAITLHRLGRVHASLGQTGKALELQGQALALGREVGLLELEASALYETARVRLQAGEPAAAREPIEAAVAAIEALRSRTPGRVLRASYAASVHSYYDVLVDVLMALDERQAGQGWNARALEASERGRARSLLEALAEAPALVREGADPGLLARERALRERLQTAGARQVQLLAGRHQPEEAAALEREVGSLTLDFAQVQAEIREASPRYADLTQPRSLSTAEIRGLLDGETALLEYSLGEERSHVWVVTSSGVWSRPLPAEREIEGAAGRLYQAMSRPAGRPNREAAALSRMVLAPVAGALRAKRLVIVADGALLYVPFAALPAPDGPGRLGGRHEVVSLPSASVLAALRREAAGRPKPQKAVAAFADPVFDAEDSRVRPGGAVSPPPAGLQRALAEAGLLGRGGRIPRLPYTRREVAALAALAPGQVTSALDFQASRERALRPDLARHRIVHIATHGVLNNEHPELSGVVLSLVDRGGHAVDGFLPLHEVYNLHLPVDLVVLSACQTALGKPLRGEGLVGLTRGFMYAGASRVVASLWKVDEVATAELMARFYEGLLRRRLSPPAALHAAQLSLSRERRFRHPYFWAGFVLQGDWQ